MSKHTPGPWHYRPYYRGGFQVVGTSGQAIPVEGYADIGDDVKEANARLISAAPDLLAAAKGIADIITRIGIVVEGEPGLGAIARLDAAIAKATSEGQS